MARNEDRAAARRAKRRGENPSDADATEPTGAAGTDGVPDATADNAVSDAERAENEARQGVVGAPVDFGKGEPIETDFDPAPGGEVVGGEVSKSGGPKVIRFFRASWAELQRVRWPDRQQVAQGTAVTLGFVVIAGAYLGIADVGARALVNLILGT
ncbi:MAG: preprotein translocase subunit SecE [Solirubrobacteraceae bacterium]|nr:preprotein translocase subunit SecE [Solirubrobacteraceae bacterium]